MTGGGRWRAGGSVFAVAVLLAGALVVASTMTARSTESTAVYAGVRRLVVGPTDGSLIVRGGGSAVTVRRRASWALTEPWLVATRHGGTLTLSAGCGGRGAIRFKVNCVIAYEMEVPPPIDLTATTTGRIEVTGVTGRLDLTSPGPITVTGARGPVSTRTRG